MIESSSTGLVYRNPEPRLRDINAWHPTLLVEGGTELICTSIWDRGRGLTTTEPTSAAAGIGEVPGMIQRHSSPTG